MLVPLTGCDRNIMHAVCNDTVHAVWNDTDERDC